VIDYNVFENIEGVKSPPGKTMVYGKP